ncbi:chemotaxis protein CheA [Chitinimonas lacunae]|uniref:Chemotaxis protein CheA n=1 Tax=Chitinimonas lacunae TaxID=1963018 RepID=A0ABV8MN00_9NEIS
MNFEEAERVFYSESEEMLAAMEASLLALEQAGEDERTEHVNAMFRAAHTIKGSAGLFDFGNVVAFTHLVESVLGRVRDRELNFDEDLIQLMLACRDHIAVLLDSVRLKTPRAPDPELEARLHAYRRGQPPPKPAPAPPPLLVEPTPVPPSLSPPSPERPVVEVAEPGGHMVSSEHWHLSLRFGRDVLRNGMDPLSFLRYLSTLGRIVYLTTLYDALPPAEEMDPEACYLGFELEFDSQAERQAIESVFDFVREDSRIRILPPHSLINEYIRLINELPEGAARLGEILVQGGALSRQELAEVLDLQRERARDGDAKPLGALLVEENLVPAQAVMAALERQKRTDEQRGREHKVVRVDATRLDELITLVGELVIAGAATQLAAQRSGHSPLVEAVTTLSGLVERIRDEALSLRMVPIGEIFSRFPRVVRDTAKALAKSIELEIAGAETELDKSMVDKLGDPLTHLVRNALDHGIESVEKRRAAGKTEYGLVWLNAYHESGSVVIEVGDDGGGMDRQRIQQRAIERGLIAADALLSDQEILQLVFEPGFSTAETITDLSGRGVGMDVVKRNIEALKGHIELDSTLGVGTVVRLRLPLTLAIIDGFQVEVGHSTFVIPLDLVIECLDLGREADHERRYINLRGEVLPYLRLREVFEIEAPPPSRENLVVVQYGSERAGLVVDHLVGELQAVIKPLGLLFRGMRGLGGSTILGSGEVALVLDVPELISRAAQAERQRVMASVTARVREGSR